MRAFAARKLHGLARRIQRTIKNQIWIDVGAHVGERTFHAAQQNPALTVYAFEPDWRVASKVMGRLANFVVLPFAISLRDGLADFFVNDSDGTSSLLPFDPAALQSDWKPFPQLKTLQRVSVPTMRLDSFLRNMDLASIEFLKIDTQGADFMVVQSLGARIRDVQKVTLEVDTTNLRLYQGSASKEEIVSYMLGHGLELTAVESQSDGMEENLTFVNRSR